MKYCFYLDWKGLDPAIWASIAQTLVALAVGVAAVYIPYRIAQNEIRRRKDLMKDLILEAARPCLLVAEAAEGKKNIKHHEETFERAQRVLQAIDSYPAEQSPDAETLMLKINMTESCADMLKCLNDYAGNSFGFNYISDDMAKAAGVYRNAIQGHVSDAEKL